MVPWPWSKPASASSVNAALTALCIGGLLSAASRGPSVDADILAVLRLVGAGPEDLVDAEQAAAVLMPGGRHVQPMAHGCDVAGIALQPGDGGTT
jgi:hypothetical protein